MQITEEMMLEFKELGRKRGKEWTDEEAYEAARNMMGLAELVYDISMKDAKLKARLKKEPKGFPTEGQYSCIVCRTGINSETGWYDWHGNKCLPCQKALDEGVIPSFICHNHDSFYASWDVKSTFKVKHHALKKYIKEGVLKPRTILNPDGTVREQIFLKKENPALVQKWNPVRKSYDRNQKKVSAVRGREWAKEMKADRKKRRDKIFKKQRV